MGGCFIAGATLVGLLIGVPGMYVMAAVLLFTLPFSAVLAAKYGRQIREGIADGQVPDLERDPFVRLSWSGQRGVWGFKTKSGQSVGGGFYADVDLATDEQVIIALTCFYSRNFLTAASGYLTLTNLRLIFTGYRFGFLAPRRTEIPYDEIHLCSLRLRIHPGVFIGSLAKALVIETRDGRQHVCWPGVMDRRGLLDQIEKLRRAG